jgi:hypothetical protein
MRPHLLARADAAPPLRPADAPPCVYLGATLPGPDGKPMVRLCGSCKGTVKLKVFHCLHPGHEARPETTARECRSCSDYEAKAEPAAPDPEPEGDDDMAGTLPVKMVIPSMKRPGIWRGGVIQIMVTRACDLHCYHCTQGSDLAGKPAMMTVDEFAAALDSLGFDGRRPTDNTYWGVVGVFGGNPAVHPRFDKLCELMRARVPFEQRGLWCNNPMGKGAHARVTFNPKVSNLNTHLNPAARAEFARDWPECEPILKGHDRDSTHGSPWVAMKDVIPDEAERWRLIGDCDVNKHWSALVGVVPGRGLRAYFCEIAYAQAALHADDPDWPDAGMDPAPGWWRRPLADFEAQVRLHCHSCGIPLRRPGKLAVSDPSQAEEFSETHRRIARTLERDRPVEFVQLGGMIERPDRPATDYLPGTTPKVRA